MILRIKFYGFASDNGTDKKGRNVIDRSITNLPLILAWLNDVWLSHISQSIPIEKRHRSALSMQLVTFQN